MCVNDDVANAGDTRFLTSGEVMAHSPESESGKYSSRTYGVQMVRHRLDTKRPMSPTSRMFGLQPIKLCRMIVVPRLGQQYIYFIQHTLNHIRRYETIVCVSNKADGKITRAARRLVGKLSVGGCCFLSRSVRSCVL